MMEGGEEEAEADDRTMTVEVGEGDGRWGLSYSCSESGKASVHASDVDRAQICLRCW